MPYQDDKPRRNAGAPPSFPNATYPSFPEPDSLPRDGLYTQRQSEYPTSAYPTFSSPIPSMRSDIGPALPMPWDDGLMDHRLSRPLIAEPIVTVVPAPDMPEECYGPPLPWDRSHIPRTYHNPSKPPPLHLQIPTLGSYAASDVTYSSTSPSSDVTNSPLPPTPSSYVSGASSFDPPQHAGPSFQTQVPVQSIGTRGLTTKPTAARKYASTAHPHGSQGRPGGVPTGHHANGHHVHRPQQGNGQQSSSSSQISKPKKDSKCTIM